MKDDFKKWLDKIKEFINDNNINVHAEKALNEIINKIKFYPIYYNKEFCMEIDNFDDLEKAKNI